MSANGHGFSEDLETIKGRVDLVEERQTWLEERVVRPIEQLAKRVEVKVEHFENVAQAVVAKVAAVNEDRRKDAELVGELHADVRKLLTGHREKLPSLSEYEPQVNPDGSASLPPGAFHSIQENIAKQQRELETKQHALELAETKREATDKALAQFRADQKREREEAKAEEESKRAAQAAIDDARIARIKKWGGAVAGVAALVSAGITWAYHLWITVHR